MPTALQHLPALAEQAERLIELGAHEIGGLSPARLREEVARARTDRGLLVMHPDRAPASKLAPLLEHGGKRGFVVADMSDADEFAPIESVELPAGPVYVTVDPDRDTDAVLADYAKAFTPQAVGLRGTPNTLASLARTYRVAYDVKKGPPYEVTHSNAVFFFDKDGKARLVTTDTSNAAAMAEDVKRLLN